MTGGDTQASELGWAAGWGVGRDGVPAGRGAGAQLLPHLHGPKNYKFIGFGDLHGPKHYKFIGFGDLHGPKLINL